jgi:hypothetical protein
MAAVLTAIEEFCKAHQYTIAAASAVGTCLAVLASLGIAARPMTLGNVVIEA